MGVRMAYKSFKLKGFLQKTWHTEPIIRHTTPPPCMPYEPFLLGVGVVFNLLTGALQRINDDSLRRERKISPKFFRPKFFRGRPRGMSMPKFLSSQDLGGLTEVFHRVSAAISDRKLPLCQHPPNPPPQRTGFVQNRGFGVQTPYFVA